jgi:hypothetical protein
MKAIMGYRGIRWDFVGILGIAALLLAAPSPSGAVELLQVGQPAPRQGILLDVPTSFKVLAVLEDYPKLREENAALRAVVARHGELDEIRVEREKLYQERIAFLELQAEKWKQLNEASLQLAKDTRESQGSWWDKFKRDAGTFSLGAVFAIGVAAAIAF